MKKKTHIFFIFFLFASLLVSKIVFSHEKKIGTGVKLASTVPHDTITGKRLYWGKRMDGYVVYNQDTLTGLIMLYKHEVLVEQPMDGDYSYFHQYKLKDTGLKSILMYNYDKKPVCLKRIHDKGNRLLRVVHEGKLNIYDGRIGFIYKPQDIDKYLLVISYGNTIDDLSSFLAETTKGDLIMYINDIYSMKIKPRETSWKELLLIIDELD